MDSKLSVPEFQWRVIPSWQNFPAGSVHSSLWRWIVFAAIAMIGTAAPADLFDMLDAYPPRWRLDTSDCEARVLSQVNEPTGGQDGGGCERITFDARLGSEAILVYPIEPAHPLDDLTARLSLMSAKRGSRIGLRVRFPYLRDTETRRPMAAIVYGATYDRAGKFQTVGVGNVERDVRVLTAKMRMEHGGQADLSDPYIDAVAINAYSGPGMTTVRIDSLSVEGMIPAGKSDSRGTYRSSKNATTQKKTGQIILKRSTVPTANRAEPFPSNDLIKILEHRGEPLTWVRSLGFDAVLLSSPPSDEILREAIRTDMLIYAPPPTAPDPNLSTVLDPVAAWYLGGGVALDQDRQKQTARTVERLKHFPEIWSRPIVIAPVESWTQYAELSHGQVWDAPLRSRGVTAAEQSELFESRRRRIGERTRIAVAVHSSPPPELDAMNLLSQTRLGLLGPSTFRWHGLLVQTLNCLEQTPRAVLFRSADSLVSGSPIAQQRSMALSFINRLLSAISPWTVQATAVGTIPVEGADYRCAVLENEGDHILLLTSRNRLRDQVLAGDGEAAQLVLPVQFRGQTIWRLTGFRAERVDTDDSPRGLRVTVVSPDVAEIFVASRDASLGTRLDRSAARFISKASSDRWQLALEHSQQIQSEWSHASISGATDEIAPIGLLNAADRTLADAESLFRAGAWAETLRSAKRADAWVARTAMQLSQALQPKFPSGLPIRYCSCPPLDQGHTMLQAAWRPMMSQEGWSDNLIASGGLDNPNVLLDSGWRFATRQVFRSESDARWIGRGYFSGRGAVRLSVASTTDEPLEGGYEGTVAVFSSPPVKLDGKATVRIDAMIKTMGFEGADQGVLVYDSVGGQAMGLLVRGVSEWTPVRLYREVDGSESVQVFFELIGDGEADIDEVTVRQWNPDALQPLPFQPLAR
ncbi:MAG: hypothetical protein AAF802_08425 [Planctomycetota bacterium]